MEAVFNILENNFEVLLVNAQHIKAVPGHKTDVKDSEWIAELLQHALLRASFVLPVGQRELRELTRHRSAFVRERATLVNRVQKVLESANIKLASVASDVTPVTGVMGVSGRAMFEAIIEGKVSPAEMAELAQKRMREKRDLLSKALEGRVTPACRGKASPPFCLDGIAVPVPPALCARLTVWMKRLRVLTSRLMIPASRDEYCRPFAQHCVNKRWPCWTPSQG